MLIVDIANLNIFINGKIILAIILENDANIFMQGINIVILNILAIKSDGASLALSNIRKRLALLNDKYHQQYKLELIDKSHMKSRGTLARFTFHADD